jgi:hypothetical protein
VKIIQGLCEGIMQELYELMALVSNAVAGDCRILGEEPITVFLGKFSSE